MKGCFAIDNVMCQHLFDPSLVFVIIIIYRCVKPWALVGSMLWSSMKPYWELLPFHTRDNAYIIRKMAENLQRPTIVVLVILSNLSETEFQRYVSIDVELLSMVILSYFLLGNLWESINLGRSHKDFQWLILYVYGILLLHNSIHTNFYLLIESISI